MRLFLVYSLFFVVIFSCKKNDNSFSIKDYSLQNNVVLNKIIKIGNKFIVVGGIQFSKASIYIIENSIVHEKHIPLNASNKEIYDVDFNLNGNLLAVGLDASVYTSKDTGSTWQFHQSSIWQEFRAVSFKDTNSATVLVKEKFNDAYDVEFSVKGYDDGIKRDRRDIEMCDIDFTDNAVGYKCGFGAVLKTEDLGNTWNFCKAKNDFFKAMCWKNKNEGIVVGYEGSILKTTNRFDFKTIRNGNSLLVNKLHFESVENINNTVVAVGENGLVMLSKDFGEKWITLKSFTKNDLKSVVFENENTFWVIGKNGAIFKISY